MARYITHLAAAVTVDGDNNLSVVELYAAAHDGTIWRLDEAQLHGHADHQSTWMQLPSLPETLTSPVMEDDS
jgi:hypothetical protein